MKILFILKRCTSIYPKRIVENLIALCEDKHEVELIDGPRKIKLGGKRPDVIYAHVDAKEYMQIKNHCSSEDILLVSPDIKDADIYIHGEPEAVFPALLDAIERSKNFSQVPGITYKVTTEKPNTWNVNILPNVKGGNLALSTRGCKGQCSFCKERLTQGNLRYRNLSQTLDEIKGIIKNNLHYRFADCSFDSNTPERMKELLRMLIKEVPGTSFAANFRPDFCKMVDDELSDLLVRAGLVEAFIGVEAFNEPDLILYNKGCTLNDIERTIQRFRDHDVYVDIGFININPFSTYEGLQQNVDFLQKYGFASPGLLFDSLWLCDAPIKQKIKDAGLLITESTYNYTEPGIQFISTFWKMYKGQVLHKNAYDTFTTLDLTDVKIIKRQHKEIAERYEQQFRDILKERSDRMAAWFMVMLDMGKRCHLYQPEDFIKMSDGYLNDAYMKETNRKFHGLLKELRRAVNAVSA